MKITSCFYKIFRFLLNDSGFLLISLIYLLSFLYMLPLRNEAYQDDWAYIQSARHFFNTGQLTVSDWSAPALVFPLVWSYLFSFIFGFSIKALHLSTIILFYFGLISFYHLLRSFRLDAFRSSLFTLALMSFPWVFQFTYSFLTDIPYLSLLMIAMLFYVKAFQKGKNILFILGSITSSLALLTRQLGLFIPISVLLVLIYESCVTKKVRYRQIISSTLPILIVAIPYFWWSSQPGNETVAQRQTGLPWIIKNALPYFIPLNLGQIGITQIYYVEYHKRLYYFFYHLFGWLIPLYLIFKWNSRKCLDDIRENWKGILITSVIFLLGLSIEIFLHPGRKAYDISYPYQILFYIKWLPIPMRTLWDLLTFITVPCTLIFIGIFIQKVVLKFLVQNKPIFNRKFIILFFFGIIALLTLYIWAAIKIFHLILPLDFFIKNLISEKGFDLFVQSWYVYLILQLAYLGIIAKLTFLKFKARPHVSSSSLFLGIFFILQFGITLIYYYAWAEYVVTMLPFILLGLAHVTRSWQVNKRFAVLSILLMVFISVNLTKYRYTYIGIFYEYATKLVEQGVEPVYFDFPDESWLPWWYYEKTLPVAIAEAGGDKYKIKNRGTWAKIKPIPDRPILEFERIGLKNSSTKNIFLDTGPIPYSLFSKTRYIFYFRDSKN